MLELLSLFNFTKVQPDMRSTQYMCGADCLELDYAGLMKPSGLDRLPGALRDIVLGA